MVCLRTAVARRATPCGSLPGRSGGSTVLAGARGRGRGRVRRARGEGCPWRNLHSVRSGRAGQAASVRGPSNQGMKRTSGRWKGALPVRRADAGGVHGIPAGARRRLSLSVRRFNSLTLNFRQEGKNGYL